MGEFLVFKLFLNDHGIYHSLTCPYTSEQNGRVERKHRQIVECGLTLLAQAKMPFEFWWDAFHTTTFNINRLPTSSLNNKTPFETLFKRKPDYNLSHPFGCPAFPCITPYNKCLFIGYSNNHKDFKCAFLQVKNSICQDMLFLTMMNFLFKPCSPLLLPHYPQMKIFCLLYKINFCLLVRVLTYLLLQMLNPFLAHKDQNSS